MGIERNADGTFARKELGYRRKVCTACGQLKWLRDYYKLGKDHNHPDGYDCRCKECRRQEKREEYNRNRKVPDGIRLNSEGVAVSHRGYSVRIYWGELRTKDFIRLYPCHTNQEVAIEMGCSVRTVVRRAREMGLEKDQHWLKNVWEANRRIAHFVNKLPSTPKADLTHFIEAGRTHRFKPRER